MPLTWDRVQTLDSKSFTCGYCGKQLASEKGYPATNHNTGEMAFIYVCHYCEQPTFFDIAGNQFPGCPYGESVRDVESKTVESLYNEARNCITVNAFTASILCCRKLLMNIAVSKGAKEGLPFIEYVEYLSNQGYVPPDGKEWVDHIRKKGNEATHEIIIMNRTDAEELITFIEMLLKFIYEFPASIKKKLLPK